MLIAIAIGLVASVVWAIAVLLQEPPPLVTRMQERSAEEHVSLWCNVRTDKTKDECDAWASDMMAKYHDEIISCTYEDSSAEFECLSNLGLEP